MPTYKIVPIDRNIGDYGFGDKSKAEIKRANNINNLRKNIISSHKYDKYTKGIAIEDSDGKYLGVMYVEDGWWWTWLSARTHHSSVIHREDGTLLGGE